MRDKCDLMIMKEQEDVQQMDVDDSIPNMDNVKKITKKLKMNKAGSFTAYQVCVETI